MLNSILPREKWQIEPWRYGLERVLLGTDKHGHPQWLILSRDHPWDKVVQAQVLWLYCGTDPVAAHRSSAQLLPRPDYCPSVAGHGRITAADADDALGAGDYRFARVLDRLVRGKVTEPVSYMTTAGAMRGIQELPLAVLFLGDAEAIKAAAQEWHVNREAQALVVAGGTV